MVLDSPLVKRDTPPFFEKPGGVSRFYRDIHRDAQNHVFLTLFVSAVRCLCERWVDH